MDQLQDQPLRKRKGQILHKPLKIDMTPLVDLGFLLISFFIYTTTLSQKQSMNLIMPKEGPPSNLMESHALNIILGGNNRIYIYAGRWENAIMSHQIHLTDYNEFNGLGKIVRQMQKKLDLSNARQDLMLIIKPLPNASYKNLVDALDEANINSVKKYAIVSPQKEELKYFQETNK